MHGKAHLMPAVPLLLCQQVDAMDIDRLDHLDRATRRPNVTRPVSSYTSTKRRRVRFSPRWMKSRTAGLRRDPTPQRRRPQPATSTCTRSSMPTARTSTGCAPADEHGAAPFWRRAEGSASRLTSAVASTDRQLRRYHGRSSNTTSATFVHTSRVATGPRSTGSRAVQPDPST